MKKYTIGEIFRLGLLKNHKGESYKHKATISRIVNQSNYKEVKTPFGYGKVLTDKDIKELNKRF